MSAGKWQQVHTGIIQVIREKEQKSSTNYSLPILTLNNAMLIFRDSEAVEMLVWRTLTYYMASIHKEMDLVVIYLRFTYYVQLS